MSPNELRSLPSPDGLPTLHAGLWHDARGDWRKAHEIAQDISSPDGARLHAYLHRKEGDHGNAAYWYSQAGVPVFTDSLEAEWDHLAETLPES